MTVYVDPDVDAMTIVLSNKPVARTVKLELGLVDLDAEDEVVAIEIFAASEILERATSVHPPPPALEDELRGALSRYVSEAKERVKIA